MDKLRRIWSCIKWPLCNALIAFVVLSLFLDTMPVFPSSMRRWIDPVLVATGLKQEEWGLFAPDPDSLNQRVSAEIEYEDGTVAAWQSPDWRNENPFSHFVQSRRLEYLDNATPLSNNLAWPGLADFIARTHTGRRPNSPLKRVSIYLESAVVPDPSERPWRSWKEPTPYGEKSLLYERKYP